MVSLVLYGDLEFAVLHIGRMPAAPGVIDQGLVQHGFGKSSIKQGQPQPCLLSGISAYSDKSYRLCRPGHAPHPLVGCDDIT